tara:strand:+ start:607 stop:837 length:231 start_codon:yes stop_codon:yes gene_type:complete
MPQIGWFEILIIVTVSIIVIGPKDFPFMLKKIGSWIGSIKKYINDVQKEINIIDDKDLEINTNDTVKKSKKDNLDE